MLGEWIHACLGGYLTQLGGYHRVVLPVDEGVLGSEVLQDAEFCIDIILHLVVIAVEVVGGDIE